MSFPNRISHEFTNHIRKSRSPIGSVSIHENGIYQAQRAQPSKLRARIRNCGAFPILMCRFYCQTKNDNKRPIAKKLTTAIPNVVRVTRCQTCALLLTHITRIVVRSSSRARSHTRAGRRAEFNRNGFITEPTITRRAASWTRKFKPHSLYFCGRNLLTAGFFEQFRKLPSQISNFVWAFSPKGRSAYNFPLRFYLCDGGGVVDVDGGDLACRLVGDVNRR